MRRSNRGAGLGLLTSGLLTLIGCGSMRPMGDGIPRALASVPPAYRVSVDHENDRVSWCTLTPVGRKRGIIPRHALSAGKNMIYVEGQEVMTVHGGDTPVAEPDGKDWFVVDVPDGVELNFDFLPLALKEPEPEERLVLVGFTRDFDSAKDFWRNEPTVLETRILRCSTLGSNLCHTYPIYYPKPLEGLSGGPATTVDDHGIRRLVGMVVGGGEFEGGRYALGRCLSIPIPASKVKCFGVVRITPEMLEVPK